MSGPPLDPGSPPPAPDGWPGAWPRLLGAARAASAPRMLVLAAVGLLLTQAGWGAIDVVSGREAGALRAALLGPRPAVERLEGPEEARSALVRSAATVADPLRVVSGPIVGLLGIDPRGAGFGRSLGAAAWGLVVWGVIGGAMGRLAVEGADPLGEGGGVRSALRFAAVRVGALLGAPAGLLALVGLLALPAAAVGAMAGSGVPALEALAGPLLAVPLLLAVPSALVVLGLLAGWPLMVLTVAVEGEDAFEALGRSFGYLGRRPGAFVGAALLGWAGGAVGLVLASAFARLAIHLAGWGLALGGPAERIAPGFAWSGVGAADGPPTWGGWLAVVGLTLHAWAFSYFWSAVARIYLVLRFEVDGTPWFDLYRPEEDDEPFAPEPADPPPSPLGADRGEEPGSGDPARRSSGLESSPTGRYDGGFPPT